MQDENSLRETARKSRFIRKGMVIAMDNVDFVYNSNKIASDDKVGGANKIDAGIFEGFLSVRAIIRGNSSKVNDRSIKYVLFDKNKTDSKRREYQWLLAMSDAHGFELRLTSGKEIDAVTQSRTHGGIAAVTGERVFGALTADSLGGRGFYVMLEGIEDPYDFGNSLRSLYASGADGIILSPRNWMNAAGTVCRSSAGASEMFPMFTASPPDAAEIFKSCGFRVVCADLRDSVPLNGADLTLPLFLIIGGEKRGISRALLDCADLRVRIDYGRDFDASLSSAAATAIIGHEIMMYNNLSQNGKTI